MTDRQRNALGIVLSIILGLVMMKSCAGGQLKSDVNRLRKTTRITTLRPIRAQGRANAGYPLLQTTANVTRVAANISGLLNPLGWFWR